MNKTRASALIATAGVVISSLLVAQTIFGANLQSSVTVGNAAPVVSAVSLNGGGTITLTPNTTTSVNVTATISDNNGCGDLTGGTTTVLVYRNGVTSSTCATSPNNLNCYIATAFTTTAGCSGTSTSMLTTTTFGIYYFAQATDASSSFNGQGWRATLIFKDPSNATGSTDSATTSLNTLNAINVTTSSISYGTLAANSDTGSLNQTTTVQNAGNSSTSLQLSALSTLISGGNVITTSSQKYATSSFTYSTGGVGLTGSAVTVSGFLLIGPTSTNPIQGNILWGVQVPPGTATGTYNGTTTFASLFSS